MTRFKFAALAAAALLSTAASAAVTVTVEAPGAQTTSQVLASSQVATFEQFSGWTGGGTNIFTGPISGVIGDGGFLVSGTNVYGGAGGTGEFGTVYNTTTINLSEAVNFAGLWASAIDGDFSSSAGNTIALYNGDTLLGSFGLKAVLGGDNASIPSGYMGNPTAPFLGGNSWEPYAFFNFVSTTAFNRIDIIQNGGGGFELDNITIGQIGGAHPDVPNDAVEAVPESATWAMMVGGFGLVGAAIRRRKLSLRAA